MLGAIGLDDWQEAAYRALIALGSAGVDELADRLGLATDETLLTLRHLERQGLAARSPGHPGQWVAAPPGVALGALVSRRRDELDRAELAAALLDRAYRAEGAAVHGALEVVTGEEPVARRFAQLRSGAAEEVCALVAGRAAEPLPPAAPAVAHRVVIERAALYGPSVPGGRRPEHQRVEHSGPVRGCAGGEGERPEFGAVPGHPPGPALRVADRVPTDLVIADRTLAIVPLTAGTIGATGTIGAAGAGGTAEPAALVVHASGLLDALVALFEGVWRAALPLHLGTGTGEPRDHRERNGGPHDPRDEDGDGDGPDRTDLEILSLLLAGLTDASTARQLDLGLRTVQRRVKRLMDLVGVTTRLQLGWHAYERGWVARSADGAPLPAAGNADALPA
ncbi:LuxR family transcriptional regulator [Streptomyces sp. XD-27]|uniref:helix-turn-helix transcriptional regulator n=1 Tax=Streptomyces sp. XD-27 TaxID=3062779 RepID=UPI0026F425A9|nr:LuxR family transcriptional regulator [Streptomyces sp. XD-27]WKX73135.1 helix-turn-helix transcriptional regulator [Streptomyces sp. XD-27]